MRTIVAVVDSRIRLPFPLPRELGAALRAEFTHSNPEFFKKKAMGFRTWGTPQKIKTHETVQDADGEKWLTLPRGGLARVRKICGAHDARLLFADRTVSVPVRWPRFSVMGDDALALRWYQLEAVGAAVQRGQGVIRAPTGSGKSIAGLAALEALGERALVVMTDSNLLKQWRRVAAACFGVPEKEIGVVGGGKYRPGEFLTLALQQTLYAQNGRAIRRLVEEDPHGAVFVDETQTVAARTFLKVVDVLPFRYRLGASADETRKDKKEFLIYDAMGPVIYEVTRDELEREAVIHPVTVRAVPTDFRADWYRDAPAEERSFKILIDEMIEDDARNTLLVGLVSEIVERGETPALIFTHRREYAEWLADAVLSVSCGIPCGLLLGGGGANAERFQSDIARLADGRLKVAVGTFKAIGTGIDLPAVRAGVIAHPVGSNRQFFGQVRGRICRAAEGKDAAVIYYLWDRHVMPYQVHNLWKWTDGRLETRRGSSWRRAASAQAVIAESR